MRADALPAIRDGLRFAGWDGADLDDEDLDVAFYGDLFRPDLSYQSRPGFWDYRLDLFREHLRTSLALAWRNRNAAHLPRGIAQAIIDAAWRQVGRYLEDPETRREVRTRVEDAVTADTRVIVAHSLGSVVAYEALCRNPDWPVHTLVTLGSPLGIRGVVFDRLQPRPDSGVGHWPGPIQHWTNIADDHDRVALEPRLAARFGPGVQDQFVYNRDKPHDPKGYLTSRRAGEAIAEGLERDE